jgi:hypothetical protein
MVKHLDFGEDRCTFCKSKDPDSCKDHDLFQPKYTKEELLEGFREEIKDPQILPREYRDVAVLLWVLGMLDGEE